MTDTCIYGMSVRKQLTSLSNLYLLIKERFVATGSRDNTVKVFDLRTFDTALDTFDGHKEDVIQVGWNPENQNILASACNGRRIVVWDRSRSPKLLFIHDGHTNKISDFSWNPNEERVVASVAGLATTYSKYGSTNLAQESIKLAMLSVISLV
ncbi:hypothetical protein K1719_006326 [Acacia pycnantha]|nr:hypothetical protein K1719_006326 [Acacia pycnantha]